MQCPSPISIPRPNGTGAKDRITVPCGKCVACQANKRADWTFRLKEELQTSKSAFFVTLTYSDEKGIPVSLCKDDIQRFIKRLRRYQDKNIGKWLERQKNAKNEPEKWKIRYYLTGEYGPTTFRPHYHALLFNLHPEAVLDIDRIWKHGFVKVGTVETASIHYVTKYFISKDEFPDDVMPPFTLMSKNPGIGMNYINKTATYHRKTNNQYVVSDGYKQRMPRYYREKLYSDVARKAENVRNLQALDENELKEKKRIERLENDYFAYKASGTSQKLQRLKKLASKNNKL